ncbi:MAG: hypothetical protein NC918_02710 [Candidatus Omnitrophica bacterium]|nr:hypothetical protein [Candidatus Omnitrophota bacterium]
MDTLYQALEKLYAPVRTYGLAEIEKNENIAKQKAFEDFAKRGIYQSGEMSKYISDVIGEQTRRAQMGLESNIAQIQAQALADLFRQQEAQKFQKEMADIARQRELSDYLRNTVMNVIGGFTTPAITAFGAQMGYKLAPDIYELALKRAQTPYIPGMYYNGPYYPYFLGREPGKLPY